MNILDQLAEAARQRVEKAKQQTPLAAGAGAAEGRSPL